jgi:hypothetical protein
MENGKKKHRQFSLIHLLFAHCETEVCRLLFVDKETNGSYPFANGLNGIIGLARLCIEQPIH